MYHGRAHLETLYEMHGKCATQQKPAHSGHAIALPWLTFFRGVKIRDLI